MELFACRQFAHSETESASISGRRSRGRDAGEMADSDYGEHWSGARQSPFQESYDRHRHGNRYRRRAWESLGQGMIFFGVMVGLLKIFWICLYSQNYEVCVWRVLCRLIAWGREQEPNLQRIEYKSSGLPLSYHVKLLRKCICCASFFWYLPTIQSTVLGFFELRTDFE